MDPEKSIVQSFEDLRNDLKSFIETRYEILRAEMAGSLKKAAGAGAILIAAAAFGVTGLTLLGVCVALWIGLAFGAFTNQVGVLWGFLAAGAGNLIVAGILAASGKSKLKATDLIPERTLRVLQRDQEALQQQTGGQYVEPERTRRRA